MGSADAPLRAMGDPYASRWVTRPAPRPEARLRLFCLPFGGGSASTFRTWPQRMPAEIELLPIQLPGRESRRGEPFAEDLLEIADTLAVELRPLLDRPFAIFGHSLGGFIAFELVRALRRRGAPPPVRLFVSATVSGHALTLPVLQASHLPDDELVRTMADMCQSPIEMLVDPKARDSAVPVLRADVRVMEGYRYLHEPPLDVPISAYAGTEDPLATPARSLSWRDQTTAAFSARAFEGAHFFLFPRRDEVCRAIVEELGLSAAPGPRSG